MKCKILVLLVTMISLIGIEYEINKIDIVNAQTEKKIINKHKPKEIKKVKKIKKKTKKEKELEYWTKVTGRKVINVTKIKCQLSFYTDLECENSSYGAVDCQGNKLTYGTIANNSYPLNTKIYIKNYGLMSINDRGKRLHSNNFDVFMPRKNNEGSNEYYKRINNMGVKTRDGYILKFEEE